MRLVSATLANNTETILGDALRSVVDAVDVCLVIDTGIEDGTLDVAKAIAGDKLLVRTYEWAEDFAAARNFALDAAFEAGGDWALMIDTDERWTIPKEGFRERLEVFTQDVLLIDRGSYMKEALFRLPARSRYQGPTHEAFCGDHGRGSMLDVRCNELPKNHEQVKNKCERDIRILSAHVLLRPSDPRWFYYLGDSLSNLGRYEEAVAAFDRCAALRGWDEESAWACYRAAEALCRLGRPFEAVDRCAAGLARHAGIAELAWLAAYASYQMGKVEQAACWARLATVHGMVLGAEAVPHRIGFKNLSALHEGPFDVLRFALKGEASEQAEAMYRRAVRQRLQT